MDDGAVAPSPGRDWGRGFVGYTRNPMITGVLTVLFGESVLTGSWSILFWTAFFFTMNHVYFIISEEPGLIKRFAKSYKQYKQHVPRWIPRLTPWQGTVRR
jgi:protein-S-isoprenylcysteine O-methyltransferase Ste14